MREAADAAPGRLLALAACIATFAARALNDRRLTWAVLAEPVDANIDALRVEFRRAIASELAWRINVAITGQHLLDQDVRAAAPAIVGALLEGLIGPLASPGSSAREAVRSSRRCRSARLVWLTPVPEGSSPSARCRKTLVRRQHRHRH